MCCLTHLHADFVAGHLELRDRVGSAIAWAPRPRRHTRLRPFPMARFWNSGRFCLKSWKRPDTRLESISILVYDLNISATQPHAVLLTVTRFSSVTWDGRFARGAGVSRRSTLAGCSLIRCIKSCWRCRMGVGVSGSWRRFALWQGLEQETVSTLGKQRTSNYALQPMTQGSVHRRGDGRTSLTPRIISTTMPC